MLLWDIIKHRLSYSLNEQYIILLLLIITKNSTLLDIEHKGFLSYIVNRALHDDLLRLELMSYL